MKDDRLYSNHIYIPIHHWLYSDYFLKESKSINKPLYIYFKKMFIITREYSQESKWKLIGRGFNLEVWHKPVPQKVWMFVWRLIQKRIHVIWWRWGFLNKGRYGVANGTGWLTASVNDERLHLVYAYQTRGTCLCFECVVNFILEKYPFVMLIMYQIPIFFFKVVLGV